jgi:hypothetical protein
MNSKAVSFSRLAFLGLLVAAGIAVGGCSPQRFYANYYADPKPRKTNYSEFKRPANPQPVYVVFDMYSSEGSFPEATRKLGPKVAQTLKNTRLFSTVSQVGSENMARFQISMRETALLSGEDAKSLPEGLTSGLVGSQGAIVYSFTASYQPPGKEAVKKVYPHAVHIVKGTNPVLNDSMPMTAAHAVDTIVEQVVVNFLRDLQSEGKL